MKRALMLTMIGLFSCSGAAARGSAQSEHPTGVAVVIEVTKQGLERHKSETITGVRENLLSYLSAKGYTVGPVEICTPNATCALPADNSKIVLDIIIDRPWNRWMTLTIKATYNGKTLLDGIVKSSAWTVIPETAKTLAKAHALLDRLPAPN